LRFSLLGSTARRRRETDAWRGASWEARPHRFPERNRLISGFSAQSLIVEARQRSGSLWTARHALEQGREVLAVPGPVDTDHCRGSNALIRDGATPVLDAEELLRLVLPQYVTAPPRRPTPTPPHSCDAARVLRRLAAGAADPDTLARELALSPQALASVLLDLELEGQVVRAGTRVALRSPP
jgi:DNA processing protein